MSLVHLSVLGDTDNSEFAKIVKRITKRTSSPTVRGSLQAYAPGVSDTEAVSILSGWKPLLGSNQILMQGNLDSLERFSRQDLRATAARKSGAQAVRCELLGDRTGKTVERSEWRQVLSGTIFIPPISAGSLVISIQGPAGDWAKQLAAHGTLERHGDSTVIQSPLRVLDQSAAVQVLSRIPDILWNCTAYGAVSGDVCTARYHGADSISVSCNFSH